MDHLICVADASTLVKNIQEIKHLVYQGRVRLVVPQSTFATIEQTCGKVREEAAAVKQEATKKPVRQSEAQRPRTAGRSARIEHPLFDINPLVAGEFLVRLKSMNEEQGVEFQKDSEHYSPWKILELEEESKNVAEDKPTTFAQAAAKQKIERLVNDAGAASGPLKPRLVARSGGVDGSAWKKSNKALSLPISEVPKESRPLLSCLLYRLHEKGATRWDTDRTLLLCDNADTNALASKLGMLTKSMSELRQSCRPTAVDSRETSGELEVYFGIPNTTKPRQPPTAGREQAEISISVSVEPLNEQAVDGTSPKEQAKSNSSTAKSDSKSSDESSEAAKRATQIQKGESPSAEDHEDKNVLPQQVEHSGADHPRHASSSTAKDLAVPETPEHIKHDLTPSTTPASHRMDLEKKHSIAEWLKNTHAAKDSDGRDTPTSGVSSIGEGMAPAAKPFVPLSWKEAVTGKADMADKPIRKRTPSPKEILSPPRRVSPVRNTSPPKMDDPIDSDEEVVVFNPKNKRLSAQKAQQAQQAKHSSKVQQEKSQPISPKQHVPSMQQVQQTSPAQRPQTPTAPPKVTHTRNNSGGRPHTRNGNQRQPRPGPPPVVIDPDSFGRNLPAGAQPPAARTFNPY
ncbi:MAG: hypothetical protein Q9174_006172, partial [Haloplaca sp. 1 TL-2023]